MDEQNKEQIQEQNRMKNQEDHKLGEWSATAICGNDIGSSCLYVSVLSTRFGGILSPILLLFVSAALFLYRKVYAEVGEALPLNGGTYNCLLNTTSKYKASIAACLTILSYIATCVISATTAIVYLYSLPIFSGIAPDEKIYYILFTTTGLLVLFAFITIIGIGESAAVALCIFIFHLVTLTVFSFITAYYIIFTDGLSILLSNFAIPVYQGHELSFFVTIKDAIANLGKHWKELFFAVFFGFSSALLGISGFESSSNFIEEQKKGVFVKTLRNMWLVVTIFNPLIALFVLGTHPLSIICGSHAGGEADLPGNLADMAHMTGGNWLHTLIVIDAVLVLAGAVLTSYVGVTGLCRRMALDRCLPQVLLKLNRRGTSHIIIISFCILCASILFLTKGEVATLAGVYTISFLSVMSLFAIGNMLLKVYRSRLKRDHIAPWHTVIIALISALIGVTGNICIDGNYVIVFLFYFIPTLIIVSLMFLRLDIFRAILAALESITKKLNKWTGEAKNYFLDQIETINNQRVIFFTRGDDSVSLNKAMMYVLHNEHTNNIKVVHLYQDEGQIPEKLEKDLEFLDGIYPKLNIEFVKIKGKFTPEFIDQLSKDFQVAKNYMFIGCPSESFPYNLSDLGGVRLII